MSKLSSIEEMRVNIALSRTDNMRLHMLARLRVMEDDTRYEQEVAKIKACRPRRRCNSAHCPICAVPAGASRKSREPEAIDYRAEKQDFAKYDEHPDEDDLIEIKIPRGFRLRGGYWMAAPFEGLDPQWIIPFTLKLCVEEVTTNLTEVARRERKRMHQVFTAIPDVIARGRFEYALKWADELSATFPDENLPASMQGGQRPHERVVFFHMHGTLYAPGMTEPQLRRILQRAYPGVNRVELSNIMESMVDEKGIERYGLAGWGEYAAMEKHFFDFGNENIAAFQEILDLERTWSRISRQFKIAGPKSTPTRHRLILEVPRSPDEIISEVMRDLGWNCPDHPCFAHVLGEGRETLDEEAIGLMSGIEHEVECLPEAPVDDGGDVSSPEEIDSSHYADDLDGRRDSLAQQKLSVPQTGLRSIPEMVWNALAGPKKYADDLFVHLMWFWDLTTRYIAGACSTYKVPYNAVYISIMDTILYRYSSENPCGSDSPDKPP